MTAPMTLSRNVKTPIIIAAQRAQPDPDELARFEVHDTFVLDTKSTQMNTFDLLDVVIELMKFQIIENPTS